ncbi:DUF3231 family protein [Bacillus pinisoli]|uniref:DUF3231 family protein n=1 Tax=Bacillus pinisoli TaxID=2901866 RepID=UPI00300DE216
MSQVNVKLTSAELAGLWTQYMNDSMAAAFLSHCLQNCKDKEIKPVIEFAYDLSRSHLKDIREFLKKDGYPIPIGFTKNDVYLDAPLYSQIY